jgi:hypothetical protein
MSADRDTTRIVRTWLRADESDSADRILGVVLDRLDTTPQRRATSWPARRLPEMNNTAKLALGVAAVVVVALLGIGLLLPGGPSIGGPDSTPNSTSEPTATPGPSLAEPSSPSEGLLPEGPHVLNDGAPMEGGPTLRTTVTIPAPDWYGEPGGGILIKNDNADAPDGAGMITFFGDLYVYGDPCEWSTTRPDEPATTVDELVAALSAQASRDASEPVDVTVDGHAGKAITLHVPDDAVFIECDRGTFGSWGVPGADPAPYRYHQDPGQIDNVWVVDVDGTLAVIDWAHYAGTPTEHVEELRAIVESITFEAP